MAREYETVIGLEVHVELATRTKIFCGCSTAFGGKPNSHTCPVCTGMPGSLPVLNRRVLEHAVAVGLATNCTITRYSKFDRKNYFYPDNPQNYQISQLYLPICRDGYVEIEVPGGEAQEGQGNQATKDGKQAFGDGSPAFGDGNQASKDGKQASRDRNQATKDGKQASRDRNQATKDGKQASKDGNQASKDGKPVKRIGIHEIHMEEDAGKLVHDEWEDCTLVDYNRSGVPLIEIVSQPDMRSAQEVIAFLEKLRLTIQYLGASDCKLQEGSMRVDVNLSVRPEGTESYGTRTEMKNLGSFRAIARAIEAERDRQIDLLESGQAVVQETRRWDEAEGCSYAMRSKEDAQDYRYFPEPDLAPIEISEEFLEMLRRRQPELPTEKRKRYLEEYDIPAYDVEIITGSKQMADLFEATVALGSQPKKVSNWLMVETLRLLKERELDPEDIRFSPKNLAKLISLVESRAISSTVAKEVFEVMFAEDVDPKRYVEEKGLKVVGDEEALRKTIEAVLADNAKSVQDYHNGKDRALGFLVGQTMKAMKGKADPGAVNRLIKEML